MSVGLYEASVEINAPPEKVWEFVNNIRRAPEWVAFVDRIVSGGDEPAQLGSVWRDYGGPASFAKSETEWRVTDFDPPNRSAMEGHVRGLDRVIATTTLTPFGEGTRLHWEIDVKSKWYFLPIVLILNRSSQRLARKSLDDAKTLIEAEQS